jgi:hypothetical protein
MHPLFDVFDLKLFWKNTDGQVPITQAEVVKIAKRKVTSSTNPNPLREQTTSKIIF